MASVLIIGSGAREDALSRAYEKSPLVDQIIISPGNDFMAYNRKKTVIVDKNASLKNPQSILEIAQKYAPDLIDVAQDDALASGAVDLLRKKGFRVFAPTQAAARLEWDKKWSREFMQRQRIPHPGFTYFNSEEKAVQHVNAIYAREPGKTIYVKATGLCAGKGALKATTLNEAIHNIHQMKTFPDKAGETFLIEEGITGEEFSYYAITDGKSYRVFKSAQDNKTAHNFDQGEQTGGMGVVSPAMVTHPIARDVESDQIAKAIQGMAEEGTPYCGILYVGGMMHGEKPTTIEYNARWGDPECQTVLPALQTDYFLLAQACVDQTLANMPPLVQDEKVRVCVVGASRGYPGDYSSVKGKQIHGLEEAMAMKNVNVYGAGLTVKDGKFYANGGRLFSIVGEGSTVVEARKHAYSAMACVSIDGNNLHYRTDIAWRDVDRVINGAKY